MCRLVSESSVKLFSDSRIVGVDCETFLLPFRCRPRAELVKLFEQRVLRAEAIQK